MDFVDNRLTLNETANHQQRGYHAADADECLDSATKYVEHEAAEYGNGEGPAVDDDLDLSLCSRACNTGLCKNLSQILPFAMMRFVQLRVEGRLTI